LSYIGVPPQATFSSGLLDRFTSTTGTTVTLTHDIASENDIVVFVNFVKQDSTTYSVGGTGNKTLTLGGTLVSSDIVEVHYLNIVGQTNAPSTGSVTTATINDTAVTGAKLNADVISSQTELAVAPASTDELLISDAGVLKRIDASLVGGQNTPAFLAYLSASYEVSNNVITKVNCNTEVLDTDSCYDNSSNYRFTPTSAGKYHVFLNLCGETSAYKLYFMKAKLYKNGSQEVSMTNVFNTDSIQRVHSQLDFIVDMNGSSDYLEMYGHIDIHTNGTEQFLGGSDKRTYFGAYKIIGA
jgi:hypothetical protein